MNFWMWKNTLLRSHHWLQANWGASFWETAKTSCESRGGPKHNRCCLISKIIERQGWIPWQLSPYVLLALEEHQGRIRSAEVNCALWNSMLKQHHGRGRGVGAVGDTQVEISGAAQPVFFSFLLLLYHGNVSRNVTPLSPECSLIILSNEKRRKRRMRERKKCMRIAILSYSLHTGCITTSLKKSLRHNKTDCIITFFPLTGCISTTLHITS